MADAMCGAVETPLQDHLRRIPCDAIYRWTTPEADREVWQLSSNSAQIGRLAHEAADRLDAAASPTRAPPPAEGAGEDLFGRLEEVVAFFEGHADTLSSSRSKQHAQDIRTVLAALSNRTSEPEAGEPVAWLIEVKRHEAQPHRELVFHNQGGAAAHAKVKSWRGVPGVYLATRTALSAAPATADKLPDDVRRLVLAARAVAFGPDCGRNAVTDALDKASEAFADRVPWDDDPLASLNEQPQ